MEMVLTLLPGCRVYLKEEEFAFLELHLIKLERSSRSDMSFWVNKQSRILMNRYESIRY
jgi:hypothetical protein